MKNIYKWVAVAALAVTAVSFGGNSRAASVLQSGSTYDGWVVTTSPGIQLVVDSATSDVLTLEKTATFTTPGEGLMITFTQASNAASDLIDFADESVTNNTGSSWGGFQFLLLNPNASASFVENSNSPFAPPAGYTTASITSDNISYTGTQAYLATSFWGEGTDGDLTINGDPLGIGTSFSFKEIPTAGGNPAPVPLPAALWQGTAGLLGVTLLVAARKRKQQIA